MRTITAEANETTRMKARATSVSLGTVDIASEQASARMCRGVRMCCRRVTILTNRKCPQLLIGSHTQLLHAASCGSSASPKRATRAHTHAAPRGVAGGRGSGSRVGVGVAACAGSAPARRTRAALRAGQAQTRDRHGQTCAHRRTFLLLSTLRSSVRPRAESDRSVRGGGVHVK